MRVRITLSFEEEVRIPDGSAWPAVEDQIRKQVSQDPTAYLKSTQRDRGPVRVRIAPR